ncbi:TonB-dependent receptor plug domain-containing protein [Verrucomicrobiota bacterium]
MNGKYILSALFAGTTALAAYGETTNEVIVTAARIEQPIEQIGSSVTLITSEELEQRNAPNLQDAIKLVPSLQFVAYGGPGTSSSVFIRGAEADHTLVLINGVRVNSNTAGGFDFSSLAVDMIESIEVVRGPQSGLYGSDALGGVINISTKKGAAVPLSGSVSESVGEKGYRTANLGLSGGNETADFNTSISLYGLSEHDIAKNNGGTEDDPTARLSIYTGGGLNFAKDGRADLSLLYTKSDTDLDGSKGNDDPQRFTENEKWISALSVTKPVNDFYTQKLSAGYSRQKYKGLASRPIDYQTSSYDASAQAIIEPSDNNTLSIGYDFRRSEAENKGAFEAKHRTQNAIFAHNSWDLNGIWFVNLGARYDDFSDIDGKATWKADTAVYVLENTRLHGSVGTGYRAPTMNDLYYTYGAPARTYLKPEQSKSFDVGIEQTINENITTDVTFFKSDVEDLIAWAEVGEGVWQPSNVNKAEIRGIEATIKATPLKGLTTKASYTFLEAEDASSGNELPRRAKHSGGISANWEYSKRGNIYVDYAYTGKRYDNDSNSRELKSFGLVNVGSRYQLTDHFSVFANVENLFDKDYETASGYGTVGRVASFGVKGEF